MKIQYKSEGPCITVGTQPLLWINGITLYSHSGEGLPQHFTKAEADCFAAQGESSSSRVLLKQCGNTVVVRLSAELADSTPLFARGNYFEGARSAVLSLGLAELTQGVAVYQHKDWWLRPAFCAGTAQIPQRTQLLLFAACNGYCALVAVADQNCRADLSGEGGLSLTLSSNVNVLHRLDELCLAVSFGSDPYQCCRDACCAAMEQSGKGYPLKPQKTLPPMLEYLGWCSWDAFYHKVNEAGLLEKMEELKQKEIPVRWVLIDDGWLDVDYKTQQLRGLDADRDKFAGGLKQTSALLKQRYAIKQVGVWHAIMGYWNGLVLNSPAHEALRAYTRTLEDGRVIPQAEEGGAFGFWDGWHRFLHQNGIDFVKVDGQSSVSNYNWNRASYGQASRASHTGLEASAALHFDGNLINCMGMAPEDIWNRPNAAVSRNSDDFVPLLVNGFREHAVQNAYNTLLHGQFYYGDWDMFWSDHAESVAGSMLRAVSGGPVYISDPVGKSDPAAIMPLVLQDGRLLRCEGLGQPTLDCLFSDPVVTGKALKLFNHWQDACLVAVFNIGEKRETTKAVFCRADVPNLPERLWLYDYQASALHSLEAEQHYSAGLPSGGANIFLLLPKTDEPVVLGNTEKYLAPATIAQQWRADTSSKIILREPCGCAIAFGGEGLRAFSGGKEISCRREGSLYRVLQKEIVDCCLEITWEAASC